MASGWKLDFCFPQKLSGGVGADVFDPNDDRQTIWYRRFVEPLRNHQDRIQVDSIKHIIPNDAS